jgi:hypothetical protein
MHEYIYAFNCTDCKPWNVRHLTPMVANAREIKIKTFRRHVKGLEEWEKEHGYVRKGDGLRLSKDWAVGFYKSMFDEFPVYFISWSCIEFIWMRTW